MKLKLVAYYGQLAESLGISALSLHKKIQSQVALIERSGVKTAPEQVLQIFVDDRLVALFEQE
jgi:hypothetical protein